MKQGFSELSGVQRVLAAFRSSLPACSSKPHLRRNPSSPIILLTVAYQQFLTIAFHLICVPITVPNPTCHVFKLASCPHTSPGTHTYLYLISLLKSIYLLVTLPHSYSCSGQVPLPTIYIQAPPNW